MTTATIELTASQAEAGQKIQDWYTDPDSQVFRLFGYAGTGKSTTANILISQLGVRLPVYAAYTGKAAYVLRSKGAEGASTIHSLIYLPAMKARAKLDQLVKQLDTLLVDPLADPRDIQVLQRKIEIEKRKLESPDWHLKEQEESDLYGSDLLIIDEVSMVGERTALDLLSWGVKTLVLGDPAQLPPVDGAGYFIDAQPNHLLTEVLRSALDSPVTRIATTIRAATIRDHDYGVTGLDGDSGRIDRLTVADLLSVDQVLVGTNNTRWQTIHLLRALKGLHHPMPIAGDRIMVLANSGSAEVFNGQQFSVINAHDVPDHDNRICLDVLDDDGAPRQLTCWRSGFAGLKGEQAAKRDGRGNVVAATYGQAVTVHKAQGSQWDSVLVVDESSVFASIEGKEASRRGDPGAREAGHRAGQRWLYTAATRAAKQIRIIDRLRVQP
ncbi:exodeoxyribonuclease V [Rhizocola hellebori]|uniref:Exodeoxyribonuclease V n=1 Tax=Rhizocola hellebori TaxID=1392758 RepID=A0A8J3VID1_9ACTN|nr:AAA family ATPase [Rhizocola hellebori]GIH07480.1 exodeoxyribonuclease V [Rhizocola hellebori]